MNTLGLAALLVLATLFEGGGSPTGLLLWHGILVSLLIAAVWRVRDRRVAAKVPDGVVLGWMLFWLVSIVGAVRAPYAYGALLVLLELAACTAVAFLAVSAGPDLLRRIAPVLGFAAIAQTGLALYQAAASDRRPAGTFLVPNHLALWLTAVALLLAGRALGGGRGDRVLAWACGIPAVLGVAMSGSRGAVLGLAAGGAWLLWSSLGRLSALRRKIVISAGALGLLLLGAGVLTRMQGHDPFRYQRFKIWRASLSGYLDDPFWGTGPGQFEARSANHRFPDGDGPLRFDRAHRATHSDWLRVPAEFGTLAALAILATAAIAVSQLARRRRRGELPDFSDGALAALVAVLVHAAVDNPSRWPAVYLLASVLAAALLTVPGTSNQASVTVVAGRRSSLGGRLVLTVGLLFVFLVVDAAPFAAWRAVSGLPRGRLDDVQLGRLEQAIRLNRIHPDYRMRLAEHLETEPLGFDAYAAARESAEHAVRLQPADARLRRDLARIEARACMAVFRTRGCRERIRDDYLEAERLSRFDPTIPLELAMLLLDLGDPVGARRAAERALALEPEAVLSRIVLAEALIEAGSAAAAGRSAELLFEAERKAEQWAGFAKGNHAGRLLALDRAQLERVRRKVATAASVDAPAEGALR